MERERKIYMMAREYLLWLGINETPENLKLLTRYANSDVDYSEFPDADISYDKLVIASDEPSNFLEFMEKNSVK